MKSLFRLLPILLITTILGISLVIWQIDRILSSPLPVTESGIVFEISHGSALVTISDTLAAQGILKNPQIFRWYAQLTGHARSIRAGEYIIKNGSTPHDLL